MRYGGRGANLWSRFFIEYSRRERITVWETREAVMRKMYNIFCGYTYQCDAEKQHESFSSPRRGTGTALNSRFTNDLPRYTLMNAHESTPK